jgi:hypothetical protein
MELFRIGISYYLEGFLNGKKAKKRAKGSRQNIHYD